MNTYSMAVAKKTILLVPSPVRGGLWFDKLTTKGSGQFSKGIFFTMGLIVCLALSGWADNKSKAVKPEPTPIKSASVQIQNFEPAPANPQADYSIPWTSINGGGELTLTSTNYKMRATTAQPVIGESQSANYKMGIGFWYGTGLFCTYKPGDVDGNRSWTLTDIVGLVNMVFKGAPKPTPLCRTDCNGSGGNPNIIDIVCLVNKVFKGGSNPVKVGVCCL